MPTESAEKRFINTSGEAFARQRHEEKRAAAALTYQRTEVAETCHWQDGTRPKADISGLLIPSAAGG